MVYVVVDVVIDIVEFCCYMGVSFFDYMVLLVFVEMDELLLIFNGKFDWKVLLVLDFSIFVSDWVLWIF